MNNFGLKRILLLLASFLTAIWAVMIAFLPWDNDVVYIILSAVVFITIGILYSAGFFIDKMLHYRPGWVLSTGLACFIVGIYLLFSVNSDISQVFVSMSMLLMFTGITLLSQSVQYRFLEIRYWFIYSLFGFVFIAAGIIFTNRTWINLSDNILLTIGFGLISVFSLTEVVNFRRKVTVKNE